MKVGILGSGMVGKELGKGFIKIGYQVLIGSRDTLNCRNGKTVWQKCIDRYVL